MHATVRCSLRFIGLVRSSPARRCTAANTSNQILLFSSKEPPVDPEEWIRPDRPLSGDKGQTHLFPKKLNRQKGALLEDGEEITEDDDDDISNQELDRLEKALARMEASPLTATVVPRPETAVDWMAARRAKQQALEMMLPREATAKRQEATDLPILKGVLLSYAELERCMLSLGALNMVLIPDGPEKRMGGGALGMLFITGTTTNHLKVMADTLVRQLKRRDLAKNNVNGALFGFEGSSDGEDDWLVVDCANYIVHFQLEETRRRLDLESLWSGKDPFEGNLNR